MIRTLIPAIFFAFLAVAPCCGAAPGSTFNVRDYGATGDGKTLDTASINKAIDACASSGGGEVLVPAGGYLCGTVHLKSNVTLKLDPGATIVGTSDLEQYQNFTPPKGPPMWGGLHWHRALLLGDGVENVTITGGGVIDGNKVFDATGEEHMRGPHGVLFGNSRNITLRDISIRDAANYAVMLEFTSHVSVRGVKITGGWDGVHFRGWKDNPCRDVSITDCEFYTGDDCIAGWYWQDTLIDRCVINSSCNGIRLIGPATNLIVHDCLFFGPGKNEHRTSKEKHRTNMLAGINIQPGAWGKTEGLIDSVHVSDVVMHDVASPFFVTARTGATIGTITVDRLTATGVYRSAASVESWADEPIGRLALRDATIEYTGGATAEQAAAAVRAPGVDARPLPAWGLYARHIKRLDLSNVRLDVEKTDPRTAVLCDGVESLAIDTLKVQGDVSKYLTLKEVGEIRTDEPTPRREGKR